MPAPSSRLRPAAIRFGWWIESLFLPPAIGVRDFSWRRHLRPALLLSLWRRWAHLRELILRDLGSSRRLADLQRANVRRNSPAVAHVWNLRRIIGHRAEAIADHVKEMPHGNIPQAIVVIRGRLLESAAHHHAASVSDGRMARGAINREALL